MLLLKLAWRNIWRNKVRSILTMLAIFFAVLFTAAMRGIQTGTYESNISNALKIFSGYMQLQTEGFQDNPTLQKGYKYDENLKQKIESVESISAHTPRIQSEGLIGNENKSMGAALFGIHAETESQVSLLKTKISQGNFLSSSNTNEIVVGAKLLKNLNASLGDELIILASGFDGSMGNKKMTVVGVLKTGTPEIDRMMVLMNLNDADELLSMYGKVSYVAMAMDDIHQLESAKEQLLKIFSGMKLSRKRLAVVLDWKELMPELKQSIELDNISGMIFLGILLLIVAFGILNTVTMSISERFREFGVMLALGVKHYSIMLITFLEMIFMTMISLIVGNLAAFIFNYIVRENPIPITGETAEMMREFGFIPAMHSSINIDIFINTSISIFIIACLSFIYPAIRIIKLEALKGIRYV